MNSEKVSVIIPVYNTESYLDRCIESVLRQSYQDLEVLLVDDGSTDGSGAKCDAWAKKDPRILVIHKKNGGVSAARNTGLDTATGEYVSFVDSDDTVASDMIEKLYTALKTNDADLSICNICYVDQNDLPIKHQNQDSPITDTVLTKWEAISKESDYENKGWHYLFSWNKLYKSSLFSDLRFPEGKVSEEDFIMHRLFWRCDKIACVRDIGYYYTQRQESIVHIENSQLSLHRAEGRLERAIFCLEHGQHKSAADAYWLSAMALPAAYIKDELSPVIRSERKEAIHHYRQNIQLSKYCGKKKRVQCIIVFLSPRLYQLVFRNSLRQNIKIFWAKIATKGRAIFR